MALAQELLNRLTNQLRAAPLLGDCNAVQETEFRFVQRNIRSLHCPKSFETLIHHRAQGGQSDRAGPSIKIHSLATRPHRQLCLAFYSSAPGIPLILTFSLREKEPMLRAELNLEAAGEADLTGWHGSRARSAIGKTDRLSGRRNPCWKSPPPSSHRSALAVPTMVFTPSGFSHQIST
jgi:hypothetical protein